MTPGVLQMSTRADRITRRNPLGGPLMGLLDKLRGELIDIIEWTEPSNNDILCYRFPRYQNEIKNGARLTVREGQASVFASEGQIGHVFPARMYDRGTQNQPHLNTRQ